jgi:hypothetical protein
MYRTPPFSVPTGGACSDETGPLGDLSFEGSKITKIKTTD